MSTSKLQRATKKALRYHFHHHAIYENVRPRWLINPATGSPLELDLFIPILKVAVEVQGEQHSHHVAYFHNTLNDFKKQVRYDQMKSEMCRDHNVKLLFVHSASDIEDVVNRIRHSEKAWFNESTQAPPKKWHTTIYDYSRYVHDLLIHRKEMGEGVYRGRMKFALARIKQLMLIYEASGSPHVDKYLLEMFLANVAHASASLNGGSYISQITTTKQFNSIAPSSYMKQLRKASRAVFELKNRLAKLLLYAEVADSWMVKRIEQEWLRDRGRAYGKGLEELEAQEAWLNMRIDNLLRSRALKDGPR